MKLLLMIQDILEKHKYAILRTADALLPFSVYYQPDNFITSKFNPEGHVFMIIGEDDENYYYVEQLSEVNEKGYRHVPGRNDIGVYEKEKFREALSIFAGVAVFQFRRQNILRSHEFSMEILRKMGYHYYNNIDDMRVKRYFAPHLISTNYFAAKAAPVILKHSESADLLRISLLPHVLRVPRSFTHL